MTKLFDYQSRLIKFAGDVIMMTKDLEKKYELEYLGNQIIRSSCSAALNFGESQGTRTNRDYLSKASISLKELMESQVNLKILQYLKVNEGHIEELLDENFALIKILRTIIKNKSKP